MHKKKKYKDFSHHNKPYLKQSFIVCVEHVVQVLETITSM